MNSHSLEWYSYLNDKSKSSLMNNINLDKKCIIIRKDVPIKRVDKNYDEIWDDNGPIVDIYKKYTHCDSFDKFYNELGNTDIEQRTFFEIIVGKYKHKPYFDIDIDLSKNFCNEILYNARKLVIDLMKSILSKYRMIEKEDIFVFNSHTEKKLSYHIVVDRWTLPSHLHVKQFMEIVSEGIENSEYIDKSVYKSIQQFRIFGTCKWGKRNYKVLDELSTWKIPIKIFSDDHINSLVCRYSLVQNADYCSSLPFTEIKKREFDMLDISDEIVEKVVMCVLDEFGDDVFEYISSSGSLIMFRRLRPSECECCRRTHESENAYARVDHRGNIVFDCRRNEDGKVLVIGSVVLDDAVSPLEEILYETSPNVVLSDIDSPVREVEIVNNETPYQRYQREKKEREMKKKVNMKNQPKLSSMVGRR